MHIATRAAAAALVLSFVAQLGGCDGGPSENLINPWAATGDTATVRAAPFHSAG